MPTLLSRPIGSVGYGLMGLTWRATPPPQSQAFAAMDAALAGGANFWNGGELYGPPDRNSLHLLHDYFTQHPEHADRVVLSIKGGLKPGAMVPDGSAANVRRSVDECLRVLDGTKRIDIFECARVDPNTPIEETIRALAQCVREGKIGGIGLSEVRASTIRRAAAVHPIAAVEVELSLWATDILRNGVADTCAELGIPIVAYSPLSRGMLAGGATAKTNADLPDHIRAYPKFQDDVLHANMRVTEEVERLAARRGCTTAQLAIAWVAGLSGRKGLGAIVPIPGATTEERVSENCGAKDVVLTEEEMLELERVVSENKVVGDRYFAHGQRYSDG
jgi:pyridoxine 4-dehydrogenase